MRRWTDRLNARERLLLALAAPLLLLLAGYHFGWQPVAEARAGLQAEIMRYGQIAALAEGSGGRPTLRRSTAPLAERATRSAETAGLSLRRLEPDARGLSVTLEDAAYSDLILWLVALTENGSVRVAEVEFARRPSPGVVSARVKLEDGP